MHEGNVSKEMWTKEFLTQPIGASIDCFENKGCNPFVLKFILKQILERNTFELTLDRESLDEDRETESEIHSVPCATQNKVCEHSHPKGYEEKITKRF
jgi:hypothetical protein